MPSSLEIRNEIVNYLSGDIDYDRFDEWISVNTWNIHKSGDQSAKELAFAVESKLAEFSAGLVSEKVLKGNLIPFVNQYSESVSFGSPIVSTSSDVKWQWVPCRIGDAVAADTKPVVVYA